MDEFGKIAHLMRRAGFGAGHDDLLLKTRRGVHAILQELLDGAERPEEDPGARTMLDSMIQQDREEKLRPQMLKPWWLYQMTVGKYPLQEKMVLFWHGHFATSIGKVGSPELMLQQNRFFRENALGSWRDIVKGISRDAAMIRWLDNDQNYKAHPNENYARELMELFTLGIGHYTEQDIKQSGRAFTGWNALAGQFRFQPERHDTGIKTFMGRTGNFDGDDIVDIILEQPAAAEYMARKLFTFFAYENPAPPVVTDLAKKFRQSNYSIRALVEGIFRSDAFWSRRAINTQVKSPAQLVVGSLRALKFAGTGAPGDDGGMMGMEGGMGMMGGRPGRAAAVYRNVLPAMRNMGQGLFAPPNVKGWDGGLTWINSATMLERMNLAARLVQAAPLVRANEGVLRTLTSLSSQDTASLVDSVAADLGPLELSAASRAALIKAVDEGTEQLRGGRRGYQQMARLRTAYTLAMQSPQYQIC